MSLSIKNRNSGDIVILDLAGRLTLGEPTKLMRETVRRSVADGTSRFVVNLGEVSYIDSAGLGELIATYTTIRNKGGDVKLLNLTSKAKDLLQMTKLLTVFDTYDDEASAIGAIQSGATGA